MELYLGVISDVTKNIIDNTKVQLFSLMLTIYTILLTICTFFIDNIISEIVNDVVFISNSKYKKPVC